VGTCIAVLLPGSCAPLASLTFHRSFEDKSQRVQDLVVFRSGSAGGPCNRHAFFKPGNWIAMYCVGQRSMKLFPNRAEFVPSDHRNDSRRCHRRSSRRDVTSRKTARLDRSGTACTICWGFRFDGSRIHNFTVAIATLYPRRQYAKRSELLAPRGSPISTFPLLPQTPLAPILYPKYNPAPTHCLGRWERPGQSQMLRPRTPSTASSTDAPPTPPLDLPRPRH